MAVTRAQRLVARLQYALPLHVAVTRAQRLVARLQRRDLVAIPCRRRRELSPLRLARVEAHLPLHVAVTRGRYTWPLHVTVAYLFRTR